MTDKELLELAAKAAGIEYNLNYGKGFWVGGYYSGCEWNPLTDDGDALRLAVKLRIVCEAMIRWIDTAEFAIDENEAVRRAIVRCAAEIGKNV